MLAIASAIQHSSQLGQNASGAFLRSAGHLPSPKRLPRHASTDAFTCLNLPRVNKQGPCRCTRHHASSYSRMQAHTHTRKHQSARVQAKQSPFLYEPSRKQLQRPAPAGTHAPPLAPNWPGAISTPLLLYNPSRKQLQTGAEAHAHLPAKLTCQGAQ
jgi:hypothetical protein